MRSACWRPCEVFSKTFSRHQANEVRPTRGLAAVASGMRARGRLRTFALVVVAAVVAAGCTRGAGGDKAGGGGEQVVLRLANYSGNLDGEPAVPDFIKRPGAHSGRKRGLGVCSD